MIDQCPAGDAAKLGAFRTRGRRRSQQVHRESDRLLGWLGIIRLGVVQAALGSIVVLVISTLNRVMVVEYARPAVLPGALVALHYAVQLARPRFGYGSDRSGRRTPWILGGMAVLAAGGVLCALATVGLSSWPLPALLLAIVAYILVGLGVGAAGTSLLVLLAARVSEDRRAAAATTMWVLMIAGFALTSAIVGHLLDPFSPRRLVAVTGMVSFAAFALALVAMWRIEGANAANAANAEGVAPASATPLGSDASETCANARRGVFVSCLARVWAEPRSRRFTLFVFVSMLAYSAQELLLEPFAGLVFGYSLGQSARLSGLWHASVLMGMLIVGIVCRGRRHDALLRAGTVFGCAASAVAITSLSCAALIGPQWPLRGSLIALGVSNGVFTIAAIGSMMALAGQGEPGSSGVRMGLWGAAQALGFALGGLLATSLVDSARSLLASSSGAFAVVFGAEALLFLAAAVLAARSGARSERAPSGVHTAVTV
jgi:BCD family chlorophyll transporter-like MFS transporter